MDYFNPFTRNMQVEPAQKQQAPQINPQQFR
jgi:hypothetical protein